VAENRWLTTFRRFGASEAARVSCFPKAGLDVVFGEEDSMTPKKKCHSPERIIRMLREADEMLAAGKTIGHVPGFGSQRADVSPLVESVRQLKAEEAKRLKEVDRRSPAAGRLGIEYLP
jgi:hypothetical protein